MILPAKPTPKQWELTTSRELEISGYFRTQLCRNP